MILVLVGESASGKSTIEKLIKEKNPSFSKVISYTTRPMRDGEKDGIDYHFVSEEKFSEMEKNGDFIEYAQYRGWNYGSAKSDYADGKDHVVVLTPHGCRLLKKWAKDSGVKILSVYINVDRRARMIKILERGDDIDESCRRNISDVGMFDGFEDEADYVVNNEGYRKSITNVYNEIISVFKSIKKYS